MSDGDLLYGKFIIIGILHLGRIVGQIAITWPNSSRPTEYKSGHETSVFAYASKQ